MKLTREFQPNPDHGYNLPEGTVVQSAKFGRTQADVWQDAEQRPIWRGEPKRIVGYASPLWRFAADISGCATTEAAAKAGAEYWAWNSDANNKTSFHHIPYRHQLSAADALAEEAAFKARSEDIRRRFPADSRLYESNASDAPKLGC